jgi:integrase
MTLYDLIDRALITHEVKADGTTKPLLAPSRRSPMRSSAKRYAAWLHVDPAKTKPDDYHRSDQEVRRLIEANAPDTLAPTTIRNLGNDVIWLFHTAVEQRWLPPLPAPFLSWRQRLPAPDTWIPRQENGHPTKYRLDLNACPPALHDELTGYIAWCEAPVMRGRDRRVAKRPPTSKKSYDTILRLAGFATTHLHIPVVDLTLRGLCHPDVIEAFINWWFKERRGKMTDGLAQYLLIPKTIAKHWLKDLALYDTLNKMQRELPPSEAIRDKQARWLSLAQLEEVGLSLHPRNARRLQDYPVLTWRCYPRMTSQRWAAVYVAFSLIIRLLIRLPMRQRCIREMRLGRDQNLFQDNAGVWQIRFVGKQLKVETRRGQPNRYEFPWPAELVGLLEEWLQVWRPKVQTDKTQDFVFCNSRGKPFTVGKHVSDMIQRQTYRFTGIGCNPHMIRDIFATEWLKRFPGDTAGVARRLGNTEAMVLLHYAHIIKADVDERADQFLKETLATNTGPSLKRRG